MLRGIKVFQVQDRLHEVLPETRLQHEDLLLLSVSLVSVRLWLCFAFVLLVCFGFVVVALVVCSSSSVPFLSLFLVRGVLFLAHACLLFVNLHVRSSFVFFLSLSVFCSFVFFLPWLLYLFRVLFVVSLCSWCCSVFSVLSCRCVSCGVLCCFLFAVQDSEESFHQSAPDPIQRDSGPQIQS